MGSSATEFELLVKRHSNCGIDLAPGVCTVPKRDSEFSRSRFPALPCRATDCIVPAGLALTGPSQSKLDNTRSLLPSYCGHFLTLQEPSMPERPKADSLRE